MAITISVQGILQGFRKAISPLILALCRLCIFVFPVAYLFTLNSNVINLVWITFIIAEFITSVISIFIIRKKWNNLSFNSLSKSN